MSQSSRSKVRALVRHRERMARLITEACCTVTIATALDGAGFLARWELGASHMRSYGATEQLARSRAVERAAAHVGAGIQFDVAAARELGERMVSDGEALELERVPFMNWCMSRGLGPDNRERGAFGRLESYCGYCGATIQGGKCLPGCRFHPELRDGRGGFPGKLAREWQRMGGRRNVAHGAQLRRMGQRLLDAIAGQTSECQDCGGCGWEWLEYVEEPDYPGAPPSSQDARTDCHDCHGTGHNLAGVLPGLVWSAQDRRRWSEAGPSSEFTAAQRVGPALFDQVCDFGPTRTVPRGEHRKCPRSERAAIGVELRDQQRGWMRTGYAADGVSPVEDRSRWPRWRRGELRHDEQRRQREVMRSLEHAHELASTSTAPRGEHRRPGQQADVQFMVRNPQHPRVPLDVRLQNRAYQEECARPHLAPRWRRGELRHAEQRRAANS